MIKKLYRIVLGWAEHRLAPYFLLMVAFVESIIFPIPPDVILVGLAMAKPKWAWFNAFLCTIGSVAGGVAGYFIGLYAFDMLAMPVLNELCVVSDDYCPDIFLPALQAQYEQWGEILVLMASISLFPYKIITLSSGVFDMDLMSFIIFSLIGRGARFYLVAGLMWYYGDRARDFIEKHLSLALTVVCLVAILIFVLKFGL